MPRPFQHVNPAADYVQNVVLPTFLTDHPRPHTPKMAPDTPIITTRDRRLRVNVRKLMGWFLNTYPEAWPYPDDSKTYLEFLKQADADVIGWTRPETVRGGRYRTIDPQTTAAIVALAGVDPDQVFPTGHSTALRAADDPLGKTDWSTVPMAADPTRDQDWSDWQDLEIRP